MSVFSVVILALLPSQLPDRRSLTCIQNHLIETASATTGSLLIWDTGEYDVLPYHEDETKETDGELSDESQDLTSSSRLSDSEKLHVAFRNVGAQVP